MNRTILDWLLEEQNPEVRLRTLKEYMKLPDDDEKVVECKRLLIQSKVYERALKKLRKEKPWYQLRNSRPASLSFAALLCSADFRLVFASRTAHWADTQLRPSTMRM